MAKLEARTLVYNYEDLKKRYEGMAWQKVELVHLKKPKDKSLHPMRANIILYQAVQGGVKILKNRYGKKGLTT